MALVSAVAVASLAIRKDIGSTPCTAQTRRLVEWVLLSARGLTTSILGLHEYMIERQKSYGAPHPRLSDARTVYPGHVKKKRFCFCVLNRFLAFLK
ncbi:unnamed protein product [Bursaphelenchus okinawaensis]|uniref:Uncharacterized protein n=1 Tax=Bursaphelenchus okinawaensis TaxID=465554 RepID=A0A811L0H7_9BILA|nr:unnamed protein product [Bursaphelenchus okinawaensis]CAG9115226.1 unnamed protein product [Bursaphelenchus okinawaensis]